MTAEFLPEPDAALPDAEKARVHYQRALNLAVRMYKPQSVPTREDRDAMLREFQRAYELCPESWSAAFAVLWVYEDMQRKDDARTLYEKLEKEPRRSPFIDNFIAHRLSERGEYQRALDVLTKAAWPPDTPLRIELTLETLRAHLGLGNLPAILELVAKRLMACEHDEARLHLLFHIEEVAMRLPKDALAKIDARQFEEGLKKLIAEHPEDVGFPVALGAYLARLGRLEEELDVLAAASLRRPDSVEMRHHFARVVWRAVATQEKPAIP
jgi:tetratricopeptide (TPR) repeat protein